MIFLDGKVFPDHFVSIIAVDYVGDNDIDGLIMLHKVSIQIYAYKIHPRTSPAMGDNAIQQVNGVSLPNLEFEGVWER